LARTESSFMRDKGMALISSADGRADQLVPCADYRDFRVCGLNFGRSLL